MEQFVLTWLAAAAFASFVIWGTNVPSAGRARAIIWTTALLVIINIVSQSYFFKVDVTAAPASDLLQGEARVALTFPQFLDKLTIRPGGLATLAVTSWYRVITSNVIHYGWLHLLYNVWFFVLFGHVIEIAIGTRKMLAILAAGFVVPALLEGVLGHASTVVAHTGGLGGPLYTVIGAYLILFPRSRCYGAVNYDLKFWAAILFLLLPVTMITRLAGLALTETVLIMGMVAAFLLIQPEHGRLSLYAASVALYKLFQDVVLIEPGIGNVLQNSNWRICGGLLTGAALGLAFNGTRGFKLTWPDTTTESGRTRSSASPNTRTRLSLARLEAEGRKTPEGARIYLGQRVFVGDADKAIPFYREIVIPKFPDLLLPLQEQIALARLLQFKGYEKEALHAYETLLNSSPIVPEEYWIAWLKAAELTMKVDPDDTARARKYLRRFEEGHSILMRDRIEAERLRALLPVVEDDTPAPRATTEKRRKTRSISPAPTSEPASSTAVDQLAIPASPQPENEPDTESTVVDIPKARPRTFLYVPGSSPVLIKPPERSQPQPTLSDTDFLHEHWKPLPSDPSRRRQQTTMLESPVKNSKLPDQDQESGMYGGLQPGATGKRSLKKGRLAHIEVSSFITSQPANPDAMPTQYGGLTDATAAAAAQPALRLRGESTDAPAARRPRARVRPSESTNPADHWGRSIPLESALAEDAAGYGEATRATGADQLAAPAPKDAIAVMLLGTPNSDALSAFKQDHENWFTIFGSSDYSEICNAAQCPIFILRNMPSQLSQSLQQALDAHGVSAQIVPEAHPVLQAEPLEVVSFQVQDNAVQLKTPFGTRRVAWDEITSLTLSRTRLTLNSRSPQRLILVIVTGSSASLIRYQLFERTISVNQSTLPQSNIHPPKNAEELLTAAFTSINEKRSSTQNTGSGAPHFDIPTYDSYLQYNQSLQRHLITQT